MSVTLTPHDTRCPNCGAELVLPHLVFGEAIICAACRHRFVPQWLAVVTRVSRKAIASFILAIASLLAVFLTGIPAIVFGILAILDIRRSKGHLTGRRLAVSGVVLGGILSVLYVPVWIALAIPLVQVLRANAATSEKTVTRAAEAAPDSERLENGLTASPSSPCLSK